MDLPGLLIIGLFLFIGKSPSTARRLNAHQLRQFNAGGDVYYVPSGGTLTGTVDAGKQCDRPSVGDIENGEFTCAYSGCRLQCNRGYSLEHGRRLYISCDSSTRTLTFNGLPWDGTLPPCLPHCRKGCAEGLTCVAPNKCEFVAPPEYDFGFDYEISCQNGGTFNIFVGDCDCPTGYTGEWCERHICTIPETPLHATIGATNYLTKMKIECLVGYEMKDGLTSQEFKCNHGDWITEENEENYNNMDLNCSAQEK